MPPGSFLGSGSLSPGLADPPLASPHDYSLYPSSAANNGSSGPGSNGSAGFSLVRRHHTVGSRPQKYLSATQKERLEEEDAADDRSRAGTDDFDDGASTGAIEGSFDGHGGPFAGVHCLGTGGLARAGSLPSKPSSRSQLCLSAGSMADDLPPQCITRSLLQSIVGLDLPRAGRPAPTVPRRQPARHDPGIGHALPRLASARLGPGRRCRVGVGARPEPDGRPSLGTSCVLLTARSVTAALHVHRLADPLRFLQDLGHDSRYTPNPANRLQSHRSLQFPPGSYHHATPAGYPEWPTSPPAGSMSMQQRSDSNNSDSHLYAPASTDPGVRRVQSLNQGPVNSRLADRLAVVAPGSSRSDDFHGSLASNASLSRQNSANRIKAGELPPPSSPTKAGPWTSSVSPLPHGVRQGRTWAAPGVLASEDDFGGPQSPVPQAEGSNWRAGLGSLEAAFQGPTAGEHYDGQQAAHRGPAPMTQEEMQSAVRS